MVLNKNLLKFEIENYASTFRKNHGFGETDPIRLESLLIKKNIITQFKPLSGGLAGMAIKASNHIRFMLVNSNHSLGKQHFTIGHELYHLYVQENFTSQRCITGLFDKQKDIEEKKADMFSASLLLPELGVFELIPQVERSKANSISAETIFKIQQYYSVSIKSVIYRLIDFKLIDSSYYERFEGKVKSTARAMGYDVKLYEPGHEGKTIGDYSTLASKLHENKQISESFYFELLNAVGYDPLANYEDLVDDL